MKDPYIFDTSVLDNGLTVVSRRFPGKKRVDAGFVVHAGAFCDPVGKSGLAHFIEHMVSKSSGVPAFEILKRFELEGGYVELGSTAYFHTLFQFRCPFKSFKKNLDFFGNFLVEASFNERAFDAEKAIIINEFGERYIQDKEYKMHLNQMNRLYQGTIFENRKGVIGSLEEIKDISIDDIGRFYETYYVPQNISVVVLSSLDRDGLLKEINASPLGRMKPGKRVALPEHDNFGKIVPADHIERRRRKVTSGMIEIRNLLPKKFRRGTINIFERLMFDLLFRSIREEKRMAYYIDLEISDHVSFYESAIYINSFDLEHKAFIRDAVMKTIDSVIDCEKEFNDVKKITLNQFDLYEHNADGILSAAMGMLASDHKILTKREIRNVLKQTTFKDMLEIAACYRNGRSYCIVEAP